MSTIVYVDVTFLVNFLVDACLLIATASFLRRSVKVRRVATGALIGSLYSVATLFPGLGWSDGLAFKWLVSVWMIEVVFAFHVVRMRTFRQFMALLRSVVAFYAVTFAAGGAVYALHNLLIERGNPIPGLALVDGRIAWWTGISTMFLVVAVPIGLFALRFLWSFVSRLKTEDAHLCEVVWRLNNQEARCAALLDTGNRLIDPVSHAPVAVVEVAAVASLLPASFRQAVLKGQDPLQALYADVDVAAISDRISIVPFRAVGGKGGYLLAMRPDEAWLIRDGRTASLLPIWMALQSGTLSMSGRYQCILPSHVADSEVVFEGGEGVADAHASSSANEVTRSTHSA